MLKGFLFLLFLFAVDAADESCPTSPPVHCDDSVGELRELLDDNPEWMELLQRSIEHAFDVIDESYYDKLDGDQVQVPVTDISSYFDFLYSFVEYVPTSQAVFNEIVYFYFLLDHPPGQELQTHEAFTDWMHNFMIEWGCFLDTAESTGHLDTFIADPVYIIEEYICPPSGWLSFNQFFAREIKPWKRKVESPEDDNVIVAPADAVFVGRWDIEDNPTLKIKGLDAKVTDYLDNETEAHYFQGGTFTHCFLNVTDYHRYHTPIGGKVIDVRLIPGLVFMDTEYDDETNFIQALAGDTWQMNQQRGLLIIHNDVIGHIGILPIGMAQVSAVHLHPEIDDEVEKGQQFGFFAFGGSDIIMFFPKHENLQFYFEQNPEYPKPFKQGQKIAEIIVDDDNGRIGGGSRGPGRRGDARRGDGGEGGS